MPTIEQTQSSFLRFCSATYRRVAFARDGRTTFGSSLPSKRQRPALKCFRPCGPVRRNSRALLSQASRRTAASRTEGRSAGSVHPPRGESAEEPSSGPFPFPLPSFDGSHIASLLQFCSDPHHGSRWLASRPRTWAALRIEAGIHGHSTQTDQASSA